MDKHWQMEMLPCTIWDFKSSICDEHPNHFLRNSESGFEWLDTVDSCDGHFETLQDSITKSHPLVSVGSIIRCAKVWNLILVKFGCVSVTGY